jgi:hypothetical protein
MRWSSDAFEFGEDCEVGGTGASGRVQAPAMKSVAASVPHVMAIFEGCIIMSGLR